MKVKYRLMGVGVSLAFLVSANESQLNIVGGEFADIKSFPFVVSLQNASGHYCGGTLIEKNVVLTAAHCVEFIDKEDITLVFGSQTRTKLDPIAEVRNVADIVVHPNYAALPSGLSHDVALLKLDKSVERKTISLISADQNAFEIPAVKSLSVGWGKVHEMGPRSQTLLQVELPLVTESVCSSAYPGGLDASTLCAGYSEGKLDTCGGDSGGPLLVLDANSEFIQIGIVSFGLGCARPNAYGVYGKVSYLSDWIKENSAAISK